MNIEGALGVYVVNLVCFVLGGVKRNSLLGEGFLTLEEKTRTNFN